MQIQQWKNPECILSCPHIIEASILIVYRKYPVIEPLSLFDPSKIYKYLQTADG